MKKLWCSLTLAVSLCNAGSLHSQKFTRENYFDFLPPPAKIISQTAASAKLHPYGNPQDRNFRDENPADGIDDESAGRLHELAAKFSPILRKNNFSVPRDFEAMLRLKYHQEEKKITFDQLPILHIDTWNLAEPASRLVQYDFVDLALLEATSNANNGAAHGANCHDAQLKRLLQEFHPDSSRVQHIRPERHWETALYFDFPGTGEKSWKEIYEALEKDEKLEKGRVDSKIYAHFFVHEDSAAAGPARYEFVVQYWLFYPFNDGGNNHEGDWEHINVRITTMERRGGLLTAADLARMLDSNRTSILDSLIIKKVDYYFHHFVMTLDYHALDLDFYQREKKQFLSEMKRAKQKKLRQNWLYERIYDRIHLLKDSSNTHPLGFIGADNIGLDQSLALPGGRNRNSHGTYPFPGVWKRVGPVGATEEVNGHWLNYGFLLPSADEADSRLKDRQNPWYKSKRDDKYVVYTKNDIILVPDWEMLKDSVLTNAEIRRKWYWLILPIRWGFPIAGSLGAGLIKHADLGNSAPLGPAFNPGWNRVGASAGFEPYEPHILPLTFQVGAQDNFQNNFGFFNIGPALTNLPPINAVKRIVLIFFESDPKFTPRNDLPFRFASPVYRPFYSGGDDDFARLLPDAESAGLGAFLQANPDAKISMESLENEGNFSPWGIMYNIHLGRFSGENAFSFSASKVRYQVRNLQQQPLSTVEGTLRLYEITSSLRHSFSKGAFQPFVRAGYGWNWYRVENINRNGEKLARAKTQTFHRPSFPLLPNAWHFGVGVEWFFEKNHDLWKLPLFNNYTGKPELGIRVDYTLRLHRLGKKVQDELGTANIARQEIALGVVLGF